MPYICSVVHVCTPQDTCWSKRCHAAVCLCLQGWQNQKCLCEPSLEQLHSSPELQRSHISCRVFIPQREYGDEWGAQRMDKEQAHRGNWRIDFVNTTGVRSALICGMLVCISVCHVCEHCGAHLAFCDYWFSWNKFLHTTCWAFAVWSAPWSQAGSSLSAPCRNTEHDTHTHTQSSNHQNTVNPTCSDVASRQQRATRCSKPWKLILIFPRLSGSV